MKSVAVFDDRIIATGSTKEIMRLVDDSTQLIDLKGKTLMPGFIDTQVFLLSNGLSRKTLNLDLISSKETIVKRLKNYIRTESIEEKQWVIATSLNTDLLTADDGLMDKDLNRISQRHPILLLDESDTFGLINAAALKTMHISDGYFNLMEGLNKKSKQEQLVLLTGAGLKWFKEHLFSSCDINDLKEAIYDGSKVLLQQGITSVHTNDVNGLGYKCKNGELYRAYEQLQSEEKLNIRIYHQLTLTDQDELETYLLQPFRTGDGNAYFRFGSVYLEWLNNKTSRATLEKLLKKCHDNKFQVSLQIDNKSDFSVCKNVFNAILPSSFQQEGMRHQIHMKQEGVSFCLSNEKLAGSLNNNLYKRTEPESLFCRMDKLLQTNGGYFFDSISIEEVLRMYTINAAEVEFSENEKGTIEIGKYADFVVLNKNPLSLNKRNFRELKVENTYVSGKRVH